MAAVSGGAVGGAAGVLSGAGVLSAGGAGGDGGCQRLRVDPPAAGVGAAAGVGGPAGGAGGCQRLRVAGAGGAGGGATALSEGQIFQPGFSAESSEDHLAVPVA